MLVVVGHPDAARGTAQLVLELDVIQVCLDVDERDIALGLETGRHQPQYRRRSGGRQVRRGATDWPQIVAAAGCAAGGCPPAAAGFLCGFRAPWPKPARNLLAGGGGSVPGRRHSGGRRPTASNKAARHRYRRTKSLVYRIVRRPEEGQRPWEHSVTLHGAAPGEPVAGWSACSNNQLARPPTRKPANFQVAR